MDSKTSKFPLIAVILRLIVLICLIGLFLIPLGTGLKMSVSSSGGDVVTTYSNAYAFIFGGKLVSEHITYTTKSVAPLGIVSISFLIASFILVLTNILLRKKREKLSKFLLLGAFLLIVLASIFMLSMHREAANVLADAIVGKSSEAIRNTIYKNTSLCFGFIGVGIFGLLGSLLILVSFFFDGTIDSLRELITRRL